DSAQAGMTEEERQRVAIASRMPEEFRPLIESDSPRAAAAPRAVPHAHAVQSPPPHPMPAPAPAPRAAYPQQQQATAPQRAFVQPAWDPQPAPRPVPPMPAQPAPAMARPAA